MLKTTIEFSYHNIIMYNLKNGYSFSNKDYIQTRYLNNENDLAQLNIQYQLVSNICSNSNIGP